MKKLLIATYALIGITILSAKPAVASCGEVTITEMNWASSAIVTAVSKFLMEQGYGCDVKAVPSSTVPALTSLAETGSPDIVTEMWMNSTEIYPKLEKEGKVKTLANVLTDGGVEAWWIPKYLADKHPELKTLDGVMKNPELVGGIFNNCPVGWACRTVNDNLIKAYNLQKSGLKIFNHGSGETMASSIAAAFADKKPWFGYYWAPTAVLAKYPMVQVKGASFNQKAFDCAKKSDCKNPRKTAYAPSRVVTGMTSKFASANPEIAKLMSNVSFTNKVMHDILAWKQKNKASNDEAAVYFITNYKEVWKDWLSADASKKLAAIIQ